jgi:hypothetical protein
MQQSWQNARFGRLESLVFQQGLQASMADSSAGKSRQQSWQDSKAGNPQRLSGQQGW